MIISSKYKSIKHLSVIALFSLSITTNAQMKISTGTGSRIPDAGAMLEIESTNRGFLPPRINLTSNTMQLNSIQPSDGMVVYNTNSTTVTGGLYGAGLYTWYAGRWNFLTDPIYISNNYAAKSSNTTGAAPQATGANAFAIGRGTQATALNSFAYGGESIASNFEAFAGGLTAKASGERTIALGTNVNVSGNDSKGFGNDITLTGSRALALGNFLNVGCSGCVLIGDNSTTVNMGAGTPENNIFLARFANGYKLFTSNAYSPGVYLAPNGSSWASLSDKRMKENFEQAEPELFLHKIDTMWLGSWNYKNQEAKTFRHYGPMAQDFYSAFGKDNYGIIGNDTTIASADMDGVNLIAIKGLVKRTNKLNYENDLLKTEIDHLKEQNSTLASKFQTLEKDLKDQAALNLAILKQLKELQHSGTLAGNYSPKDVRTETNKRSYKSERK